MDIETNGTTNGTNGAQAVKAGRCPANGTIHLLNDKEKAWRKTKCPTCGKEITIKDNHFTEDFKGMTIPNHNRVVVEPPVQPLLQPESHVPQLALVDTDPPRPGDTVMRSPDGEVTVLDRAPLPIDPILQPGITAFSPTPTTPAQLTIDTNDQVIAQLKALTETGLFGRTIDEVAERLLCERLRRVCGQGWTAQ